jgi:hypothetical protein
MSYNRICKEGPRKNTNNFGQKLRVSQANNELSTYGIRPTASPLDQPLRYKWYGEFEVKGNRFSLVKITSWSSLYHETHMNCTETELKPHR